METWIVCQHDRSEPAEVKHLSKRRKRERKFYSLSSGERTGRSLNLMSFGIRGCKTIASGVFRVY